MTIQNVKLKPVEAAKLAGNILAEGGPVIPTTHAKQRMRQREFTLQDVVFVLEHGSYGPGYWNAEQGNYDVTIKGYDVDGEELKVQIGLDASARTIVIVTGVRPK
jgi:hypothetical protein